MEPPRKRLVTSNDQQRANDLNDLFRGFESHLEQMADLDSIICISSDQRLEVAPHIICLLFKGIGLCTKKIKYKNYWS